MGDSASFNYRDYFAGKLEVMEDTLRDLEAMGVTEASPVYVRPWADVPFEHFLDNLDSYLNAPRPLRHYHIEPWLFDPCRKHNMDMAWQPYMMGVSRRVTVVARRTPSRDLMVAKAAAAALAVEWENTAARLEENA